MTKHTNRDIMILADAIRSLEIAYPDLPIKIHYANNKNRRIIAGTIKDVEGAKTKLLEKYGIVDKDSPAGFKIEKDGRSFSFKNKDAKKKFEEEINPIMEEEVKLDLYMIDIDEFTGINVSKQTFPLIDYYIDMLIKGD